MEHPSSEPRFSAGPASSQPLRATPAQTMPVRAIDLEGLSHWYGSGGTRRQVLQGVHLQVALIPI